MLQNPDCGSEHPKAHFRIYTAYLEHFTFNMINEPLITYRKIETSLVLEFQLGRGHGARF